MILRYLGHASRYRAGWGELSQIRHRPPDVTAQGSWQLAHWCTILRSVVLVRQPDFVILGVAVLGAERPPVDHACGAGPGQQWQPLPTLATSASAVTSTTGSIGTLLVNPATGLCLNVPATATPPLTLAYCASGYPRQTWRTS